MATIDFEKFVRQQQGPLRRFLMNLSGGNKALSDDIAQEAFLKAYVSLPGFMGRSKMSTWLFRIAYFRYIDYMRAIKRNDETSLSDNESCESLKASSVDESLNIEDRNNMLYSALGNLNDSERIPILLFYIEDKSIREIAEIMDVNVSVIKMRLSRGRAHLKEYLVNLGYER